MDIVKLIGAAVCAFVAWALVLGVTNHAILAATPIGSFTWAFGVGGIVFLLAGGFLASK